MEKWNEKKKIREGRSDDARSENHNSNDVNGDCLYVYPSTYIFTSFSSSLPIF